MTNPMRPEVSSSVCSPESYARIVLNLAAVAGVLLALGWVRYRDLNTPSPKAAPPPRPVPETAPTGISKPPSLASVASPKTLPLPLDSVAVAEAEAALEATRRDQVRAETRAASASADLRAEAIRAAKATLARKRLPITVRDPSSRLHRANGQVVQLRAETERLKAEGAALARAPKPRAEPLIDKSPVAQLTDGEEYHFEIRRDRVAFIDLDKLMERVRNDARVRLRIAGPGARRIGGSVGPVGSFSLQYEMALEASPLDEMLDVRPSTFLLTGWEIVPEASLRGETYEVALMPASEFARATNRLQPGKTTVTFWVYPDGFALYRKLRDRLHDRGFLVAARPLPEGIPIRGSPNGSFSASQ
jgi:hypothetical protein